MGRIFTIALALIVFHGLVAVSPIMAQQPDRWGSLVGNWNMEFSGKDGEPLAKGHFVFHADQTTQQFVAVTGPGAASGEISETPHSQYEKLPCDGSFVGGNLNLDCWPFRFFYLTLRLSADGNTLRGTWTNSRNGEPEGLVRWTRAKPPTIEKVEALSEDGLALDHAEMEQAWADDGRPQLRLRLQGRDLPIWIGISAEPRKDIAIDDPNYRIVRERLSISDLKERWKQGAFEVVVQLEPGARPGRKTITVNGSSKTFDVVFRNYQEASKVIELRYVQQRHGKYVPIEGELKHGAVFYIEAAFDAPSGEKSYSVSLDWGAGSGTQVTVTPSSDSLVFRSEAIRLQTPAAKP